LEEFKAKQQQTWKDRWSALDEKSKKRFEQLENEAKDKSMKLRHKAELELLELEHNESKELLKLKEKHEIEVIKLKMIQQGEAQLDLENAVRSIQKEYEKSNKLLDNRIAQDLSLLEQRHEWEIRGEPPESTTTPILENEEPKKERRKSKTSMKKKVEPINNTTISTATKPKVAKTMREKKTNHVDVRKLFPANEAEDTKKPSNRVPHEV